MAQRLVILTYESPQANLITNQILVAYPGRIKGIVRSDVTVAGKGALASAWFLTRHTGLGFVGRKAVELALSHAAWEWARLTHRSCVVPSLADVATRHSIPLVSAADVNAPATLDTIRGWQPDLLVSIYLNQRIRATLLRIPAIGALNVHGALLPRNRGLFPYFWTLANDDRESGVTVHWVDEQLDSGDVVVQRAYPILPDDTVETLAWMGADIGAELLLEALTRIDAGDEVRVPQNEAHASYYSWPTRADVARLRARGRRYGSLLAGWRAIREPRRRDPSVPASPR